MEEGGDAFATTFRHAAATALPVVASSYNIISSFETINRLMNSINGQRIDFIRLSIAVDNLHPYALWSSHD